MDKKFLEKEIRVKADDADIVAVHRIPGKAGESKPILVKLKITWQNQMLQYIAYLEKRENLSQLSSSLK